MGAQQSLNYFSEEYEKALIESNEFLDDFFIAVKNNDNIITSDIFYTRVLQGSVTRQISKKIFKVFSHNGKMNFRDLRFFYAAFYTIDPQAKIYLISLLIFKEKDKISLKKYMKRVKIFFFDSTYFYPFLTNRKLLSQIVNDDLEKSIQKRMFQYILEVKHKNIFEDYTILKQYTIYNNNKFEFICPCGEDPDSKKNIERNFLYTGMKAKFEEIQKKNNGIFPLKILGGFLKECNVPKELVDIIESYLELKMNKNFLDYESFFDFVTKPRKLKIQHNELLSYIFEVLSFPQKEIKKDILESLLNEINSYDKKEQQNFFSKLPSIITLEIFLKNSEYLSNLENIFLKITIIPYKIFLQNPETKEIESLCVHNYLNNNNSVDDYFRESVKTENNFYCIPVAFWENYIEFLSFISVGTPCGVVRPVLDLLSITQENSADKLSYEAIYLKDFYIIPENLYLFVKKQNETKGSDIQVKKIEYDRKYFNNFMIVGSGVNFEEKNNILQFDSILENKIIEIELHLINVYFILLNTMTFNFEEGNIEAFIQEIEKMKKKTTTIRYSYSKVISLNDIKRKMISLFKINEYEESEMYLFDREKFIKEDILIKDQTLLGLGVNNSCICLLDTKDDKDIFLMDYFFQKKNKKLIDELPINTLNGSVLPKKKISTYRVSNIAPLKTKMHYGITNLKNNCYINCILQIILNNPELIKFFNSSFFEQFYQEYLNKEAVSISKILYELIKEIRKKMATSDEEYNIYPLTICNIINKIDNHFGYKTQQDASEFFLFLIDQISKETELFSLYKYLVNSKQYEPEKKKKNVIIESQKNKLTEKEKGQLYLAKDMSFNCSYINSLFSFCLKSCIECKVCGDIGVNYEKAKNLDISIPNAKFLTALIVFHPLPKGIKIYEYQSNKNNKVSFSGGIPIKIKMNIETDKQIIQVVEVIKKLPYLDLEQDKEEEQNNNEIKRKTYFLIYNNDYKTFIQPNCLVKYSFINNTTVHIYELLNSNGIKEYNKLKVPESSKNIISLYKSAPYNIPESMISEQHLHILSFINKNTKESESFFNEYPVIIKHRYVVIKYPYLFHKYSFETLPITDDFILINNTKENIKIIALYEYILAKYTYLLSLSLNKYSPWWRGDQGGKTKKCFPFILKTVNKETFACSVCPWYKFCKGCTIVPRKSSEESYKDYVSIDPNTAIIVEWCGELVKNEFNNDKLNLCLDYDETNIINAITSEEVNINQSIEVNLQNCLDSFFRKEELDNKIFCTNCNQLQKKIKYYSIYTLPKYLTITLKRFFSYDMGKDVNSKNETFVSFPLENFQIDSNPVKYNLFAVINHLGTLNGGHYYCFIKIDDKWFLFNDKVVKEIDETKVLTNKAYILIYKENGKNTQYDFMYYTFIKSLLNINDNKFTDILGGDDFLFEGEPVWADKTYGFVKEAKFEKDQYMINVQFEDTKEIYRRDAIRRDIDVKETLSNNFGKKEKKIEKSCYAF